MSIQLATAQTAGEQAEALKAALHNIGPGGQTELSAFSACLMPLLNVLGWRGDARDLTEALPHFAQDLDLGELRNVLVRLGYRTSPIRGRLSRLDERMFPMLFVSDRGVPFVALSGGRQPTVLDVETGQERQLAKDLPEGTAYVIEAIDIPHQNEDRPPENWFAGIASRFRRLVAWALALTFFANIMMIIVPLTIMTIFDRVIGAQAPHTLVYLVVGVFGALGIELCMRALRARIQSHIAARMEFLIGTAAFEQVLSLPIGYTASAPVGGQISRLKEFESLRDFFSSPLANLAMDLPFMVVFLAVIWLVAGPLVAIPLVLILAFIVLGIFALPALKRQVKESGKVRSERHILAVEALANMRSIKQLSGERVWAERFRDLSADVAMANFKVAAQTATIQNVTISIMMVAGIATLGFGIVRVMDGLMTVGALIATTTLIWRVLAPIQSGFMLINRLEQIIQSVRQLNQLMRFQGEKRSTSRSSQRILYRGHIQLTNVSHRYAGGNDPALQGVSLNIQPGQLIAVTGASGSGKSTLLKIVLGLYRQSAGVVEIDGIDTRQLDPIELRQSIGYVPQVPVSFYGTIGQNLRMSNPAASDEDLAEACRLAAVLKEIEALPEGFATRIGDHRNAGFPAGFMQRLALARAYVRRPAILLLDEASAALDNAGDSSFMTALTAVRGRATVIYVTHRPSHMKLADRVVVFHRGMLVADAAPDVIVPKLMGQKS